VAFHGFELTARDRRLLRSPPPARALRWCAEAVGHGARVSAVAALDGGMSSAVHAVDLERTGHVHRLILRRFVRADWLAEEPDVPRREAAALELLATTAVPTPGLVAVDETGAAAGVPALLMTRLPGKIDWEPAGLDTYLARLAAPLPEIHATPLPPAHPIPDYRPYELEAGGPPRWSAEPGLWERAFEAFRTPPPARERRFIHRDYHPGNVLWRAGAVSGIVDWPNASVGSPDADAGHCRMNLAGAIGPHAADRFLARYLAISGREDYHPYWDLAAVLGGFSAGHWTAADERFVASALARL
jgi:aminoglycoside phosphotransferase (APT) family kinase protein